MAQQQQQQFTQFIVITAFTAIACAVGGFYFGVRWYVDHPQSDPRLQTSKPKSKKNDGVVDLTDKPKSKNEAGVSSSSDDELIEVEEEDEDEDNPTSDYKSFTGNIMEECKLVLLVRTDLGMTKGKIAAQCGHATLACYKAAAANVPTLLKRWEYLGQAKIALKVDSEDDMLLLQAQAMSMGLIAKVIRDAGRTQIAANSATVLGIGPGPKSVIDQVTGHLKLL